MGVTSAVGWHSRRLLPVLEAEGLFADAAADDLFEADEGAAADEKDVGGIDEREFLVRMLAAAGGRNVGDGAFEQLEQRLLDTFAGDVAGDGGVSRPCGRSCRFRRCR